MDHRKQGISVALLALIMALAMVFVSEKTGAQGGLGQATDYGPVGAERARADSLPTGKPINDGTSEFSAASREGDDGSELATAWIARVSNEPQWFADCVGHAQPGLHAWRTGASIGARGPPVG